MADTGKPGITDRIKHALHLDKDSKGSSTSGTSPAATSPAPANGVSTGGVPSSGAVSTPASGQTTAQPAGATVKRRDQLLSSDEHWQKAQEATRAARDQAKQVEAGARSHREAYEEYYQAERNLTKTKNTVEEIETRIRGFDISGKKAEADRARDAYEAEKQRLRKLAADADAARSKAEAVEGDVNAKGQELESRVAESKLHSDRLAALQAEIDGLRANENDAKKRHTDHLALLDPLRQKLSHHKGERGRVADKLAQVKAELDDLTRKEDGANRELDNHASNIAALEAELAELEGSRKDKELAVQARQRDLDGISASHAELAGALGDHRQKVGDMTKDTQAAMETAQLRADEADKKAADLQQAQAAISQHEGAVTGARQELAGAAAQQRQLENEGRAAAADVETHAQRASALQAELQAAKERMDLAQAKKEELWEISKKHGNLADEASDAHYVEHVAKPAGEDPTQLVNKTDTTADVAGVTTYGGDQLAIDHQKEVAPPQTTAA